MADGRSGVARLRLRTAAGLATATALVVALTMTLLAPLALAGAFAGAGRAASDRFFPAGSTSDQIVVVEIDAGAMGRNDHAELIKRLADGGASAVLYDVVFDRAGDAVEDEELERAIAAAGNVVLASTSVLARGDPLFTVVEPVAVLPRFGEAARAVAHAGVWLDPDRVVRALPVAVDEGRSFAPSLSAAAVAIARGQDPSAVVVRPRGVEVGGTLHPTLADSSGLMAIGYAPTLTWAPTLAADARGSRPAVRGADVLAGAVHPEAFIDKVVLVGDAADIIGGDFHLTPVSQVGVPGVWIHANAVNTMLTAQYRTPTSTTSTLLFALAVAVATALAALVLPLLLVGPAVVGIGALFLLLVDVRFQTGTDTDVVFPSIAIVLAVLAAIAVRYVAEIRDKRRVAALFGSYVPPAVADELVASGRLTAASEGQRLEISTFFADLRGFTATAATLEPSQVRALLDIYYEHVTGLILAHGGTVMQYVGDEVFAIFGAPVPHDDHVQRAVDCAVAVRDAVVAVNGDLASRGLPAVAYGIGINTGSVVAAHVGTFHRQYSVIGDPVNVGSRLCALALAGHVTFPEEVRSRLARVPGDAEPYGPVYMKGVEREVEVHVARRPGSAPPGRPSEGGKAGPAER